MKTLIDFIVELIVAIWERLCRRRHTYAEFADVDPDREAPTLPSGRHAIPTLHEYCTHCGEQVRLLGAHTLECPQCGRQWSTDFPPSQDRP